MPDLNAYAYLLAAEKRRRPGDDVMHPQAGALRFAVSELDVPAMPEAHIVVYTPRDDDTRARMPLTRRTSAPAQAAV